MAYSTDLIPTMTSETDPSGTVTKLTQYSGTYAAWKVFDDDNATAWLSSYGAPQWIGYQFPEAKTVTCYTLTSRASATYAPPKTWTLKGSNDGTDWTTLDTQTDVTDWASSGGVKKTFEISNTTAYAYYQLAVSEGNDAGYVALAEMELLETEGGVASGDLFLDGVWG